MKAGLDPQTIYASSATGRGHFAHVPGARPADACRAAYDNATMKNEVVQKDMKIIASSYEPRRADAASSMLLPPSTTAQWRRIRGSRTPPRCARCSKRWLTHRARGRSSRRST